MSDFFEEEAFSPEGITDFAHGVEVPQEGEEYEDYSSDEESIDSDLALINAQLQWEESLQQLSTLVSIVILPLIGKMIGRKFAGILWRKAWDYLA